MFVDLDEVRRVLSDIQISFLELTPTGEDLEIGLIDYLGQESRLSATGIYQMSVSRVPGDKPSYTILSCSITELSDTQIEKRIPGYGITYVRWPQTTQRGIHLRLEGDMVLDLTCTTLDLHKTGP
jgi:hypothetical protein